MEVVAFSGTAPFKREIHEWQHIDSKTGALLSGRLEADRYVNGNINTYGKSLSQNVSTADGTEHTQHKQMNILQTRTSNGSALQVVRAQTFQTSSSRRATCNTTSSYSQFTNYSDDFQHPVISSGSDSSSGCELMSINPRGSLHHHHQQQQQQPTTPHSPTSSRMKALLSSATEITTNRKNHLFNHNASNNGIDTNVGSSSEQTRQQHINRMLYGGNKESDFTLRGRSASIEELTNIDETSFDGDVEPSEWKRVSKIRRSLQFPKTSETRRIYKRPPDLPESVNVWKIKQDIESIENGRRLNAVMKNNHVDFVALDSILKDAADNNNNKEPPKDDAKPEPITAESLKEIRRRLRKLSNEFLYKDDMSSIDEVSGEDSSFKASPTQLKPSPEKNTRSLELRKSKERDTTSDDWLNRRKSYGFEKMHQPATETFGGIESSTDSGIGRSSDLTSQNWSPVDSQRTIITFGDKSKPATTSISLFSNPQVKSPEHQEKPVQLRRSFEKKDESKRHSIAVDESRFVDEHCQRASDRKISLVNLNGNYDDKYLSQEGILDVDLRRHHKKVEFCKTEIHFAADSGRVNIVETDGKPPPTNNFRRRRRSSGGTVTSSTSSSFLETINSELPLLQNGDERKSDDESPQFENGLNHHVTTTIGSVFSSSINSNREDDTDDGQYEDSSLRGILKNKPAKPKPFYLGDNIDGNSLWGVRLKPVDNQHNTWRHSADLESMKKSTTDDQLEIEFKNLVKGMDDDSQPTSSYQSTVTNTGYSTKINLSALSTIPSTATSNKDTSSPLIASSSSSSTAATHRSAFTNFTDSCTANGTNNVTITDKDRLKGHKISIDLKLPHPNSINLMDELKSTSLIIKTMKTTSYFDDAVRQLEEQESPLIRTSSLRLNQDHLPKSSSTNNMFRKKSCDGPPVKYSSSLDGDRILDDRNDGFEFLNGFLEENRKFQISIAQKENSPPKEHPVAAPRLKKIMNSNVLSQQLSTLKLLYDANDSDDNAKADEEVKSYLSANDDRGTELSGSWSRVRVKKIANSYQPSSSSSLLDDKWNKAPLTSLYEDSLTKPVEAPRTSLIKIGSDSDKTTNIYNNMPTVQHDNSVKVNIQNFESRSPALSRNNSLRIKKDDNVNSNITQPTIKLSTGTRQLRDHELTYFGISKTSTSSSPTSTTTISNVAKTFVTPPLSSSSFTHLSTHKSSSTVINSSTKSVINTNISPSMIIINNNHHQNYDASHNKPDLIMHSEKIDKSTQPEAKKSVIDISPLDNCIDETNNLEPLYENLYQQNKVKYDRKSDLARDEKILDELTRAADEIMNTCKEMYHADSEEKRRKSQLSNTKCLETITEGKQQRVVECQQKVMKSKGVQVSRNFEDSLRRYHRTPQRTSSQSSIESLPRNSKVTSSAPTTSSTTSAPKVRRSLVKSESSTVSSSKSSSSRSKRENGINSDGTKHRIIRVSSRERMQQSNASSSEDLPNSSIEAPRRPRRTKIVKSKDENGNKSSRLTRSAPTDSSIKRFSRADSKTSTVEPKLRTSMAKASSTAPTTPNTSSGVIMSSSTTPPTSSNARKSRR